MGTGILIVGLAACSTAQGAASSPGNQNQAASTADAGSTAQVTGTPGNGARGTRAPGAAGTVQSINGTTVTIQPRQPAGQSGAATTVEITSNTTIRKQVTGAIGDLKAGDTVSAFGQPNGNVVQARQITVGNSQGGGSGQGQGQGQGRAGGGTPSNGTPRAGNANGTPRAGNANGTAVIGTVDSISGDTITVKTNSGSSVQVQLAANGRIVVDNAATASDIQPGEFLVATGQQQGTDLVATTINLSTTPPAGPGGPGGGTATPASG